MHTFEKFCTDTGYKLNNNCLKELFSTPYQMKLVYFDVFDINENHLIDKEDSNVTALIGNYANKECFILKSSKSKQPLFTIELDAIKQSATKKYPPKTWGLMFTDFIFRYELFFCN